ncbi:divalent-cation tolerance protein CutA [Ramlibacter solisilvae]
MTVTTTVASLDQARALAALIMDRRLAACVQLDAIAASLYRWQGELCEEPEVRLSIKTVPGQEAALEALFAQHHPYELPQFLAGTQAASAAYARWVREAVISG